MALWSDSSKYACTFPIQVTFTLLYQMVNLIFAKYLYLYGIFVHILYQLLFNITNHRKGFACCGCSYPKLNCRLSLYSYRWSFSFLPLKGFEEAVCPPLKESSVCEELCLAAQIKNLQGCSDIWKRKKISQKFHKIHVEIYEWYVLLF